MKISVIVLHYSGIEETKECLTSLYSSTYSDYEIFLVDNGSLDRGGPLLKKIFPKVLLLETHENLGFAGGNNVAIQKALDGGTDFLFLLNNDAVVDAKCLEAFALMSKEYPQAVLGGFVHDYKQQDRLQHFGGNWDAKRGKLINEPRDLTNKKIWKEVVELDFVKGCSLFVPASIFRQVGLLEEKFFLYYEEIDWCFRAKKMGYPSLVCSQALLWHKEGASFASPKPPQAYYQSRNRLLFVKRHLSKIGYARWIIRTFTPAFLNQCLKLLLKQSEAVMYQVVRKDLSPEKRIKLKACYATLKGVKDYFFARFGKAPSTIHV